MQKHHTFYRTGCLKTGSVLLGLSLILAGFCQPVQSKTFDDGKIDVLMLIPHHWGANTFFNLDNFKKMGWHLTSAAVTPEVEPCKWFQNSTGVGNFVVDHLISEITDVTQYDVVAIMSSTSSYGPYAYDDLRQDPDTLALIRSAVDNGLVVWATCAGVRVLAAADVINGRQVIGSSRFQAEYEAAGATYLGSDHPPLIDGPIVTTVIGNYYHHHITQAIARALERDSAAQGAFEQKTLNLSQQAVSWQNSIATNVFSCGFPSGGRDICRLPTGDCLVTGFTWANGNPDAFLMKIDKSGNCIWSRSYGGPGWEYGNGVCPTDDGGAIFVGSTTSHSATGDRNVYVVRTDATGAAFWQKTFGGNCLDDGRSVCRLSTGDFIIAGHTESEGSGEDDALLMRITDAGTLVWSRTFGGERADMGMHVCESRNGTIAMASAYGLIPNQDNINYCISEWTLSGDQMWSQEFGNEEGEGFDYPYSLLASSDGGFLMTGSSDTTVPLDTVVIKTEADGTLQWQQSFPGPFYEYGMDAVELNDGYIIAGNSEPPVEWNNDLWMISLDRHGNNTGEKRIGGSAHDWITSIAPGENGEVMATGHTRSGGSGTWDIFVCRIETGASPSPGVSIEMPSTHYAPGDPFYLTARLWNPASATSSGLPLFVFLDIAGAYYFWPSWTQGGDFRIVDLQPGSEDITVLPSFPWPAHAGNVEGIVVYAGMTNATMTELAGTYDFAEFGWED